MSKTILPMMLFAMAALASARAADLPALASANATNRFEISGMHCDGCARGLAAEFKATPGVAAATVTFSNKLAVVAFDTDWVTTAKLVKVAGEAGYQARLVQQ